MSIPSAVETGNMVRGGLTMRDIGLVLTGTPRYEAGLAAGWRRRRCGH